MERDLRRAVVVMLLGVLQAGCPELGGCRSDGDCPEGYHCSLSVEMCRRGNPHTIIPGGSSSVDVGTSSSSTSSSSSSSSSGGTSVLSSSSASVMPSSGVPASSTSSSGGGFTSSSLAPPSSSLEPGPPQLSGGFVPGPTHSMQLQGGFLMSPPRARFVSPNGLVLEGGFE